MRPLAVLLVVLVAIGALISALLFMGDGAEPATPLGTTARGDRDPAALVGDPAELSSSPGTRDVEPVAAGSGDGRTNVRASHPAEHYENELLGRVVDRAGEPVPGARVTLDFQSAELLFEPSQEARPPVRETTTNAAGEFAMADLKPSDYYTLYVTHDDYCPAKTTNVQVVLEGSSREPDIVMKDGSALSGFVRDTGGAPIAGAELVLDVNMFSHAPGPLRQTAVSDASGAYRFPHVAAGMQTLIASADGFGTQAFTGVTFNGRDPLTRDIELQVAAILAGRVVDAANGEPVAGADVLALNYSKSTQSSRDFVRTDSAGHFSLERLSAGDYTVMINAYGYNTERVNRIQTGELNLVVELDRKAIIRGKVIASDTNQPIREGTLQLRTVHKGTEMTSRMDVTGVVENGDFVLRDVPEGDYVIEASAVAEGYAPTFSDPFTITEGEDLVGLVIRVRPGAVLRGRVVDERGSGVANAVVSTHDNNYTYADDELSQIFGDVMLGNIVSQRVRTGSDGSFEIGALRPDVYQINVTAEGFVRYVQREIRLNDLEQRELGDVELSRGGVVRGTLYDAGGVPLAGGQVHLRLQDPEAFPERYQAKSDSSGAYVIENIRPGNYSISATSSADGGENPFRDILQMRATESKIAVNEGRTLNHDLHLTGESDSAAPLADPRRR